MDFKALLPGLLGLLTGSVSPQAGRAGAMGIEFIQNTQDRNRRQTLEDERMEMSRGAEQRAVESHNASLESHEWARADQIAQDNDRRRAEDERVRARDAAAGIMAGYDAQGREVPAHLRTAMLGAETEAAVGVVGKQIQDYLNDTPVSLEFVQSWQGNPTYFTVRLPAEQGGGLVKMYAPGKQKAESTAYTKGATSLLNAGQAVQKAGVTLEQARGAIPPPIDMTQPGFDPKAIDPLVGEHDVVGTRKGLASAELGAQQAGQDFSLQALMHPDALPLVLKLLGISVTEGADLTPQSTEKKARPGEAGAAYARSTFISGG